MINNNMITNQKMKVFLSAFSKLFTREKLIFLDCSLHVISASRSAVETLGISLEEILGQPIQNLPFMQSELSIPTNFEKKTLKSILNIHVNKNESWRLKPIFENYELLGWFLYYPLENIINHDEDYLHYLQTISEVMPGNFYWKDSGGHYIGCNQSCIRYKSTCNHHLTAHYR